ncbi:cytochrome P450 [Artomyces pyxidatus]|uniref:Cytochrome P450 n=1 Tax=Artomyces pyxidatus TaxID=48021 RepID=A0ACB8T6K8_9AGAM|nr:cytochrome P450 [Artomyces pyxidatus]
MVSFVDSGFADPGFYKLGITVFVICAFVILGTLIARRRNTLSVPPGPVSYPVVGSVFSIPAHAPWKTYATWSRKYQSDLVAVRAFGQLSIIINTKRAAKALYERHSATYADRPKNAMITLMGWDYTIVVMPYSDEVKAQRRLFHHTLHATALPAHYPLVRTRVEELLQSLHLEPKGYASHVRHYAASIAMSIAYGYDIAPKNDRFVDIAEQALEMFSAAFFPGAAIVNAFPFLARLPGWLPGMGFKAISKRCLELTTEMQDAPFAFVKRNMAEGTECPSMAAEHLELNEAQGGGAEAEKLIKRTTATVYAAGGDTTISAINTALLAMLLHQSAVHRAQAELDRVVGRGRLPVFEDRASLPFVGAFLREILRWQVTLPLGLPHTATKDDVYDGCLIPKGSVTFVNAWAILHDPEAYPEPEAFKPERFLTENGLLNDDDVQEAFGLGRRSCPGIHLADATVWIVVASVLALYNITKAKDDVGNEVPVHVAYTDGVVSHPLPFRCSIRPRDKEAEELIQHIGRG